MTDKPDNININIGGTRPTVNIYPLSGDPTPPPEVRVFISYARADAPDFAQKLHDDLERQQIVAWLDMRDMPVGNNFIKEISDAIQEAHYFLLIFTPGAVESINCKEEWKRALEYYKPIVPILRIGEYKDLPEEAYIYLHHAPDFTSDATYETSLETLLLQLRKPPRRTGSIRGVHDLPRNHVPREDEIGAIRALLTSHKTAVLSSVSKRVGIHGMGGIGKSVIAKALARDYVIRRTFSDGIFWLTFGTQAKPEEAWVQLREWLDGSRLPFQDVRDARNFFEQKTAELECLIILDDLWHKDHAEAFLSLGEKCRLLVITRHSSILTELDAHPYAPGLLSDSQSREILAKTTGINSNDFPVEADSIIQKCGNLPLAIAMVGGLIKRVSSWKDVLEALEEADLEYISTQLQDYPYPNLFVAIDVSVNALDNELRERYYDFAVFSEDAAIPETVILKLWKPFSDRQIRKKLSELVERNLLHRNADNSFTIHDLLLVYIRLSIQDITQKHIRLLELYNPEHRPWYQIKADDGYIHDNLIYHLVRASRRQEIMDLFLSPHWMNVRKVDEIPYYHRYLNDLQRAKEVFTTDDIKDIPIYITLSQVEQSVREVFDKIPEELPGFLIVMKEDIERVILPLALMRSYRGKQVEYLEKIGEILFARQDYKNAERIFLLAANTLLQMSNSEIMSETDFNGLWGIQSRLERTGCNLARFGKIDHRIFTRLREISEVKNEYDEYAGVLYKGAIAITNALAEHGYLDLSLETLELALNNVPEASRHSSLKASRTKTIVELLIYSKHFELAEKVLEELDAEREDTHDLWGKYLLKLNESEQWIRFKDVWEKVSRRHPDKAQKILRYASSFRTGMDANHIIPMSHAEIKKYLQQRNRWDEYSNLLKYYRIFYATRFTLHVRQGHFTEAEKDIDTLLELKQIDEISNPDKYEQLKAWAGFQHKAAFQLLNLEETASSKRYSEELFPSPNFSTYSSDLCLSLAIQGRFSLLKKIVNLDYSQRRAENLIQAALRLEGIKGWQLLPDNFFEDISTYIKESIIKLGYSFMVFQESGNENYASIEEFLAQIELETYQKRDIFVMYVLGVALREGIEKGLGLLREFFSDEEWEYVRHGFALTLPFVWLRSPEEAEAALNQCFKLIWDKEPGYHLLTDVFWRLSTELRADELAARMDHYIKQGYYDLKRVVNFAKDMLFIDEIYSRNLIISLLKMQIPEPQFVRYSDIFRKDSDSDEYELVPETVQQLKHKLGMNLNLEAFNLLMRTEKILSVLRYQLGFPAFDFSHLVTINQGKIRIAMQEIETNIPSEIIIADFLSILERLKPQEHEYGAFPYYVLVGNLWTHHYPPIHQALVSRLIGMANSILSEMQFDDEFNVLIFAHFLGLVANTISGQKALQILDHHLQYLNDNPVERDTYFSRSNMLPYIFIGMHPGKEREELMQEHLSDINQLNILLEMFAYFDATGETDASNLVKAVLMEKAAMTDISLPSRPDWSADSWSTIGA